MGPAKSGCASSRGGFSVSFPVSVVGEFSFCKSITFYLSITYDFHTIYHFTASALHVNALKSHAMFWHHKLGSHCQCTPMYYLHPHVCGYLLSSGNTVSHIHWCWRRFHHWLWVHFVPFLKTTLAPSFVAALIEKISWGYVWHIWYGMHRAPLKVTVTQLPFKSCRQTSASPHFCATLFALNPSVVPCEVAPHSTISPIALM